MHKRTEVCVSLAPCTLGKESPTFRLLSNAHCHPCMLDSTQSWVLTKLHTRKELQLQRKINTVKGKQQTQQHHKADRQRDAEDWRQGHDWEPAWVGWSK